MLPHIPRFARLVILALALVTIPSLYLFYPSASAPIENSTVDAGGIDQEHFRDPQPPSVLGGWGLKPWNWGDREGNSAGGEGKGAAEAEMDLEGVCRPGDCDSEPPKDESNTGSDAHTGSAVQGSTHDSERPADKETEKLHDQSPAPDSAHPPSSHSQSKADPESPDWLNDPSVINGGVIMPKLGNATAKAELGRATWKFLHLVTLKYPERPTPGDRQALKSFFHLFSRLYPCGECAEHFQGMLREYPPQTSSRDAASMWLCELHNIVNKRLHKPDFDCLTLKDVYDCGCGDNATESSGTIEGAQVTAALPVE